MKSIKSKMILSIIVIILVFSIVNLFTGIFVTYCGVSSNVESDLTTIGNIAEIAILSMLNEVKEGISDTAEIVNIGDNKKSKAQWIDSLKEQKEKCNYETISIVDSTGNIISDDSSFNGKNISDKEYFKKALNGEIVLTTTDYDINGNIVIFVCAPVDNDNDFKGIVMATLSPFTYSNVIKDIRVGETGNIFMLDKEGVMIANIRPNLVEERQNFIQEAQTDKSYKTSAAVYKNMIAGKTGIEKYSYLDSTRICYYSPIPETDGWSFGAVVPTKEMTSAVTYTIIGLIISTIICMIFSILIAVFISNSISNPILKVTKRMKLLSEGNLNSDIEEIKSNDEIGILSNSLKVTIYSLRSYIYEISHILQKMSEGDMRIKIENEYKGDFNPIKISLNSIVDSLNSVLSDINEASGQVANDSQHVSMGSQAMAQGATEQASSIENLSSSIDRISAYIQSSSENAQTAKFSAENVGKKIEQSNSQMIEMIKAMSHITRG